eukprot:1904242-Alexandrium_andersonii.AAC.1
MELQRALAARELPPVYLGHPVVKEAAATTGEPVHPLSIYLDGVAFSRTDSCLGLWCYAALTGNRYLIAAVRRSEICGCGCRGWCTLHSLWAMVSWSLHHLLLGRHPSSRHDGTPFRREEQWRADLAGQPLGYRAVVLFI